MQDQDLAAALERLAVLDENRYTDPDSVIEEIAQWWPTMPRLAVPEGLGVLGSAYRINLEYDLAEKFIRQGLDYADQVLDHAQAGGHHQRLSMVWWNRMDYPAALEENRRAIARHEDAGFRVGVARSMVDRGIFLGSSGLFQWSTDAFLRGLEELPEETERRNRFAAFLGIAHNFIEIKDLDAARPFLKNAEEYTVIPRAVAQLQWNYGTALSLAGCHEDATKKIWVAANNLRRIAPVESALATIDLAKALIRAGKPTQAHQVATLMNEFTRHLKHNKAAQTAAHQLTNLGLDGKGLTLALLEEAKARVSQARSHKA